MLLKKGQRPRDKAKGAETQSAPTGDHAPDGQPKPMTPIGEKVRVSADVKTDLYRRLRIHIAKTNSRINTFIEEMIEKHC
jgi:hypothetical protein